MQVQRDDVLKCQDLAIRTFAKVQSFYGSAITILGKSQDRIRGLQIDELCGDLDESAINEVFDDLESKLRILWSDLDLLSKEWDGIQKDAFDLAGEAAARLASKPTGLAIDGIDWQSWTVAPRSWLELARDLIRFCLHVPNYVACTLWDVSSALDNLEDSVRNEIANALAFGCFDRISLSFLTPSQRMLVWSTIVGRYRSICCRHAEQHVRNEADQMRAMLPVASIPSVEFAAISETQGESNAEFVQEFLSVFAIGGEKPPKPWEVKAATLKHRNPNMSNAKIASEVRKSPGTLSKSNFFKNAVAAISRDVLNGRRNVTTDDKGRTSFAVDRDVTDEELDLD